MSSAVLDGHLATCPGCTRWLSDATRLTRSARVGTAAVPDLTAAIMRDAVLPAEKLRRRRRYLRIALLIVGIAQVLLALPDLFGVSIDMPMGLHDAHESAAFNIAVGVALLGVARRPARAAALLPMLLSLVALLVLLGARDMAAGVVPIGRLATHLGMVAGLALLYSMQRMNASTPPDNFSRAGVRGDSDVSSNDTELGEGRGDHGIRGVA